MPLALWLLPVLAADLPVLDTDFKMALPPLLQVQPPAAVVDGVLRTATQEGWRRCGLLAGPLPLPSPPGRLVVRYTFRPLALGPQSQEFTSETPSTHWYMLYADATGRFHLHTRAAGQWQQRQTGSGAVQVGQRYEATVTLTRSSFAARIVAAADGALVADFAATPVDDLGDETAFYLCDEGVAADSGQTVWERLTLTTDDPRLAAAMADRAAALAAEQRDRAALAKAMRQLRQRGVALLPFPRQVAVGEGQFRLRGARLSAPATLTAAAAEVAGVLQERANLTMSRGSAGNVTLAALPRAEADPTGQGYRLTVTARGVSLAAAAADGFYYGAQTLAQLVRADGTVPAVTIHDRPAIPERLVMVAIDQGGFYEVNLDYWQRLIRELAAVKINRLMPYFEGAGFAFKKYPFLALRGERGFTPAKARALSAYARAHHVKLLPQQQSLGHSAVYFEHPELRHLREEGGTFCSSKPETFAFLGDLYDELLAAFPDAPAIHVGGDEFGHNFAKCPQCSARAAAIGQPGLYAEHLNKLHAMLRARGRKMMIWWHEEGFTDAAAAALPKDIAVYDWHYGNQPSYPTLTKLQQEGFGSAWATPAVTRYYDPGNDFEKTFGNIGGFLRAGAAAKVPGECTCTWVHGIWGGRNLFELNLYALLYSGQCAWNPAGDDVAEYQQRWAQHWLGLRDGELAQQVQTAVHRPYGAPAEQGFWRDNRALEPLIAAPPAEVAKQLAADPKLLDQAAALLRRCATADATLAQWQAAATRNRVTVEFLRHDVRIHETVARKLQWVAAWAALPAAGDARATQLAALRTELTRLLGLYDQLQALFDRSIAEAGGGPAGWGGWYPLVAGGGVQFRLQPGRDALRQLEAALR
ncbi:MAG: family 20 glycosylhydrolase [Fimbriimonadaceae bacterium]|nr:family 20 glycosylhydrolase [Fimbriimonadaceae bacterium]